MMRPVALAKLPVLLLAAFCLASCGDDPAAPEPPRPSVPYVQATFPGDDYLGVQVDSVVEVLFSEAMDPESATGSVTMTEGQVTALVWRDERTLQVLHTAWPEAFRLELTVGGDLRSAEGVALAASRTITIWTTSERMVLIDCSLAHDGLEVGRNDAISLSFSRRPYEYSLTGHVTISTAGMPGSEHPYRVAANGGHRLLIPDPPLPANTDLDLTVSPGLLGQGDVPLTGTYVFAFTTGSDVDTVPPTLTTRPANGTMNVPHDTDRIDFVFSEPVAWHEVGIQAVNVSFEVAMTYHLALPDWNAARDVMTLHLPSDLPPGLPVELTLWNIRDRAGNPLARSYTASLRMAGTAAYVPVVDGEHYYESVEWWRGTQGSPDPDIGGEHTDFQAVTAQPDGSHRRVWYAEREFLNPTGRWEEYHKRADGLYWLGSGEAPDPEPAAKAGTAAAPLLVLPLPLAVGDWQDSTRVGAAMVTVRGTVVGRTDLPFVPGDATRFFKDAWQVERRTEVREGGLLVEVEETVLWYAPTLGEVHRTVERARPFVNDRWYKEMVWRLPFRRIY